MKKKDVLSHPVAHDQLSAVLCWGWLRRSSVGDVRRLTMRKRVECEWVMMRTL
jgi:hypothetical protein